MGPVRFFLALAVVVYHVVWIASVKGMITWPPPPDGFKALRLWPMPGDTAVEAFFMVSGYFMSAVLTAKFASPAIRRSFATRTAPLELVAKVDPRRLIRVKAYYASRVLRIYPIYFTVLLATILLTPLFARGAPQPAYSFAYMDFHSWKPEDLFFWALTNIAIVGKELWHLNDGSRIHYQFIAPAWTLSLELQFYLVAPFLIFARRRTIILLVGLSLLYRMYGGSYAILPYQLSLFLLGLLSHRLFGHWQNTMPKRRSHLCTLALCAATMFYPYLSDDQQVDWVKWLYFTGLFFALPLLAKRENALSGYMGDLSYPVYLVHMTVIGVIAVIAPQASLSTMMLLSIVSTLVASVALIEFVGEPIARYRQQRDRHSGAVLDIATIK
jgi:peptidoglycan/LPS O-acetylase OafA/YrhL